MTPKPPRITNTPSEFDPQIWKPGTGQDPARYLVNPGKISAIGKTTPGMFRHVRPYIASGNKFFDFPVGVEGFRRSGTASLGLHHYIGDNAVDGVVMHFEEARIELNGTFPGITAQRNMVDCINILRSTPPDPGLIIYAPGVFNREQYCLPESWEFTHEEDDRTHSIAYQITFVRLGEGRKVANPKGIPPPPQPGVKKKPKGKPHKIFKVRDGARTFRAIAKIVYKDANKWGNLVSLNKDFLESAKWRGTGTKKVKPQGIPTHSLPYYRWPIGTRFRY